jgi:hypothetical protein
MKVDGSTVSKIYKVDAHASQLRIVEEFQILFSTDTLNFNFDKFVSGAKLTNGLLIEFTTNGTKYTLANVQSTEDFYMIPRRKEFQPTIAINTSGVHDFVVLAYKFPPFPLVAGGSDKLEVTVRDDLTTRVNHGLCMVAFGEEP